ncbi:hypothetical protein HDV00_008299 [Rhizophlyctis rosea]|nr:hypothetical protein HDV00_008299 [Rhizophlyctis rosea]
MSEPVEATELSDGEFLNSWVSVPESEVSECTCGAWRDAVEGDDDDDDDDGASVLSLDSGWDEPTHEEEHPPVEHVDDPTSNDIEFNPTSAALSLTTTTQTYKSPRNAQRSTKKLLPEYKIGLRARDHLIGTKPLNENVLPAPDDPPRWSRFASPANNTTDTDSDDEIDGNPDTKPTTTTRPKPPRRPRSPPAHLHSPTSIFSSLYTDLPSHQKSRGRTARYNATTPKIKRKTARGKIRRGSPPPKKAGNMQSARFCTYCNPHLSNRIARCADAKDTAKEGWVED